MEGIVLIFFMALVTKSSAVDITAFKTIQVSPSPYSHHSPDYIQIRSMGNACMHQHTSFGLTRKIT